MQKVALKSRPDEMRDVPNVRGTPASEKAEKKEELHGVDELLREWTTVFGSTKSNNRRQRR
jgi:hypothetical protein